MFSTQLHKNIWLDYEAEQDQGRFCKSFSAANGGFQAIAKQISAFLETHPQYKIKTMKKTNDVCGTTITCYFEEQRISRAVPISKNQLQGREHAGMESIPADDGLSTMIEENALDDDREDIYATAVALSQMYQDPLKIQWVIELFDSLGDYKDSMERAEQLEKALYDAC